tara:strand:- start:1063 stop:1566 length:504 start_codon:yes stop_codon:yes gene_type:complete
MKLNELQKLLSKLSETDLPSKLSTLVNWHKDIIILGNGGSNSIASHLSQDYTKALNKKCISFSDPSRLTCYTNDYGQDKAYEEFLKTFSNGGCLVILISSSGESKNMINCLKYCQDNKLAHVILTGFSENNLLKKASEQTAELSYWVDSDDYGIVENLHQILLHSVI